MKEKIIFKGVNKENLDLICEIQNEIFPREDARKNYEEQINKSTYRKEQDYYIVYLEKEPIGITGIYSYHEYPNIAWLGWYGILEKYRKNGYGGYVLDKTIDLAKSKKYKEFRLYTDEYATSAHKLYNSRGFIKEIYDNENDKDEFLNDKIYIYSLSLNDEIIELWNNKNIGLKEQSRKEH